MGMAKDPNESAAKTFVKGFLTGFIEAIICYPTEFIKTQLQMQSKTNPEYKAMKSLMMLKEKCSTTDDEWDERQKTRQLEIEARPEVLAILGGDDARDLFFKTSNFVQSESKLAYKGKLVTLTCMKQAIDDMITELMKQKVDEIEIKRKDFCIEKFNTDALWMEKKERQKVDKQARIEDLKTLTTEIDTLKSVIAEMQVKLKHAEDREKQNKEFKMTVADQRATQKLLMAALGVLQNFHGKKTAAALSQRQELVGLLKFIL